MRQYEKKILGLYLTTNSIGWILITEGENQLPLEIINGGVRVFTRTVEDKNLTPKNVKRRQKRLARRLIQRKARRKKKLISYLIKKDLLPETLKNTDKPENILNEIGDPYILRKKALDKQLSPHEIGRIILHINTKRGFLSSRENILNDLIENPVVQKMIKNENIEENNNEDESVVKNEIKILQNQIEKSNARTLGEYLSQIKEPERKVGRYTGRSMLKNELRTIFNIQNKFNPTLFTNELFDKIYNIIFFQRPIKVKKNRLHQCYFEKYYTCAHFYRLEYQQFRYWKNINDLQYLDPSSGKICNLSFENKVKIAEELENKSSMTWRMLKKKIGLHIDIKFNLEINGVKKLIGNETAFRIRQIWNGWDSLEPEMQKKLVEDLIRINKKLTLKKRLIDYWGLTEEVAISLILLYLQIGKAELSLKAIKKLLPFLKKGNNYNEAIVKAGYDYQQMKNQVTNILKEPPIITNPIIQKSLYEVRKLINAIIMRYGKPDIIRIEMVRDLKMTMFQRKRYLNQQKNNYTQQKEAEEAYQNIRKLYPHLDLKEKMNNYHLIKYRLWCEQNAQCIYTGNTIGMEQLFSNEIEIDHILPYARTLDDSYMNKVVCFAYAKKEKGNLTPSEAFYEEEYEKIKQAIKHFSLAKQKRFYETELDGKFILNQLNDTRYICRFIKEYISQLGCEVYVTNENMTKKLRYQWGLNRLINNNEKNDYRINLINAFIISLKNIGLYEEIISNIKENHHYMVEPLKKELIEKLTSIFNEIIISHQITKKITGALHEETVYKIRKEIDGFALIYRKKISDLNLDNVDKIVDPTIKQIIKNLIEKNNGDIKKTFSNIIFHVNGKTPIKSVYVYKNIQKFNIDELNNKYVIMRDQKRHILKCMCYGNNHHVEIIRDKKTGKIESKFITAFEAANRVRYKKPIISKTHGDQKEFIYSLCINDLVKIKQNNNFNFYRVQKLDSHGKRLLLRLHTAMTIENDDEELEIIISKLINDYQMQLIKINILGMRND